MIEGEDNSSLSALFETTLLQDALDCGIKLEDYWNYSLYEITQIIESYNRMKVQELEEYRHKEYSLASLIAHFVGCVLNGNSIPTYEELHCPQEEKPVMDNETILLKERLIDFANQHNKQRKEQNGNSK